MKMTSVPMVREGTYGKSAVAAIEVGVVRAGMKCENWHDARDDPMACQGLMRLQPKSDPAVSQLRGWPRVLPFKTVACSFSVFPQT